MVNRKGDGGGGSYSPTRAPWNGSNSASPWSPPNNGPFNPGNDGSWVNNDAWVPTQGGYTTPHSMDPFGQPGAKLPDPLTWDFAANPMSEAQIAAQNNSKGSGIGGNSLYDQLLKAALAIGSGDGGAGAAINTIRHSYDPTIKNYDVLKATNTKHSKADQAVLNTMYNQLQASYGAKGKEVGSRYAASKTATDAGYGKQIAGTNSRYDAEIAQVTADLTRLHQEASVGGAVSKINARRQQALDNLTGDQSRADTTNTNYGNINQDWYSSGGQVARTTGHEKVAGSIQHLSDLLGQIDLAKANTMQQRDSAVGSAQMSAAGRKANASAQQFQALMNLANLQRNDALGASKIGSADLGRLQTTSQLGGNAGLTAGLKMGGMSDAKIAIYSKAVRDLYNSDGNLLNGQHDENGTSVKNTNQYITSKLGEFLKNHPNSAIDPNILATALDYYLNTKTKNG